MSGKKDLDKDIEKRFKKEEDKLFMPQEEENPYKHIQMTVSIVMALVVLAGFIFGLMSVMGWG
ncbi:hypothetical protein [Levilactobacillus bambusae]|uniref:Uncharacterized protein n=1 Tax=Levilactobacillus bambusae TaxID=2024736 RepID=A0A2V1N004_9LACO|nr:hypothetical protein [Levilactobacillus bambusae]PWF99705.1 hypothetical protein DCM90_06500 [Levilactobacillus bambusae]